MILVAQCYAMVANFTIVPAKSFNKIDQIITFLKSIVSHQYSNLGPVHQSYGVTVAKLRAK